MSAILCINYTVYANYVWTRPIVNYCVLRAFSRALINGNHSVSQSVAAYQLLSADRPIVQLYTF